LFHSDATVSRRHDLGEAPCHAHDNGPRLLAGRAGPGRIGARRAVSEILQADTA
jgi:hypothetical protein